MARLVALTITVLVIGFVSAHFVFTIGLILLLLALVYIARRWGEDLLVATFDRVNQLVSWDRLWLPVSLLNLDALRFQLRKQNLFDTGMPRELPPRDVDDPTRRSADGGGNDPDDPDMGRAGMRFGRNFPLHECVPDCDALLNPHPREISRKLMARDEFKPATTLNLLAAAWIQFQVHDWMAHKRADTPGEMAWDEVPLDDDDDFPDKPMRVIRNIPDSEGDRNTPPTFINTESHWWDSSGIYGKSREALEQLRTGEGGHLLTEERDIQGRIEKRLQQHRDERYPGIDHTGFVENYWVGLSMLHTLFTLEHNSICDALSQEYPEWDDAALFEHARLINCALIAKIHTVEWTPGILSNPALQISMDAQWWGLQGHKLINAFGRLSHTEEVSGIIGSATDHHSAPYALTEEFAAVYRMHPLIPDSVVFRSHRDDRVLDEKAFVEVQGNHTRPLMEGLSMTDIFYSFGVANPGAICLRNYPDTLRNFQPVKEGEPPLDLASIDILRDRERGVPRYNRFRELLHKAPVKSFDEITSNREWAEAMEEVYEGDVNQVDLMVGLLAEDMPEGFGFSDTAFRIFIVMASRRLKSDRFFTRDYTPDIYTPFGLRWIDENGMASVLKRHYPELGAALYQTSNPFAPWRKAGTAA